MYNHPLTLLWAGVVVIFLGAGVHRQPFLLLAAVPAALVHWVLRLLGASGNFTFSESAVIGQVFAPLAAAMAGILVLAPRFGRRNGYFALLAAAVALGLIGTLWALAYNFGGNEIGRAGRLSVFFYLIVSGSLLGGMALAFLRLRIRYVRPGFTVGLLVWTFVLTVLGILVFGLYDYRPRDIDGLMEILIVGVTFGGCTCGVALPFLILLHASAFFRRSFEVWPEVGSASRPGDSEPVG